ncbi:MAG: serine hydrolase domain-containing protein [Vicinamibacterales bacterium]
MSSHTAPFCSPSSCWLSRPPPSRPGRPARPPRAAAGWDQARLAEIDGIIATGIADGRMPGAVVVVGRGDTVVFEKAYGQRATAPLAEPMTLDTVFDMASLTKVRPPPRP